MDVELDQFNHLIVEYQCAEKYHLNTICIRCGKGVAGCAFSPCRNVPSSLKASTFNMILMFRISNIGRVDREGFARRLLERRAEYKATPCASACIGESRGD